MARRDQDEVLAASEHINVLHLYLIATAWNAAQGAMGASQNAEIVSGYNRDPG